MPANLWKKCKFCDREVYTGSSYCPICKQRLDGTLEFKEIVEKEDHLLPVKKEEMPRTNE